MTSPFAPHARIDGRDYCTECLPPSRRYLVKRVEALQEEVLELRAEAALEAGANLVDGMKLNASNE